MHCFPTIIDPPCRFERTAQQRKDEIRDIDLDQNDRIAYIEYLLLHYKGMILTEYYKRTKENPPHTLENNCIGVTGVGNQLLDELFTLPIGLDPELVKAIEGMLFMSVCVVLILV